MFSRTFKIALGTALVATSIAAPAALHSYNARLRASVLRDRQRQAQMRGSQEENGRLKALVALASGNTAAATVHADLLHAREELATAEKKAREQHATNQVRAAADAADLAQSRSPELGLTRLEHFQNVGQASPASGFQTLVWAIMKGDDAVLTKTLHVSPAARASAESFIASLSEEARAKSPTPERLAALVLSKAILGEVIALHVTGQTFADPQHATLDVRGLGPKDVKLPMQLGPTGWELVMPPALLEKFQANWNRK